MSLRYLSTIVLASLTWAFLAAGTVVAQQTATLTGSVEDSEGNPLPGANVVLADTDFGTAAGPDGSYTIDDIAPGTYEVRVTFVGYETIEEEISFDAGAQVTRNFTMAQAPLQGEGVTVTVGSRARDVAAEDMAVPVDVYGSEEIKISGAFETGRVLEQIAPSVNFPQQTLADGMDALRSFTLRGPCGVQGPTMDEPSLHRRTKPSSTPTTATIVARLRATRFRPTPTRSCSTTFSTASSSRPTSLSQKPMCLRSRDRT
ncbi:MAG: hypothetical protein BRD53_05900 [Bacteroidetes bacterium SW_7_64_58]|nr:MAG: hypothetical protein BRD53_05900 [Bacteroidetes bacterium SW_7_64_58]